MTCRSRHFLQLFPRLFWHSEASCQPIALRNCSKDLFLIIVNQVISKYSNQYLEPVRATHSCTNKWTVHLCFFIIKTLHYIRKGSTNPIAHKLTLSFPMIYDECLLLIQDYIINNFAIRRYLESRSYTLTKSHHKPPTRLGRNVQQAPYAFYIVMAWVYLSKFREQNLFSGYKCNFQGEIATIKDLSSHVIAELHLFLNKLYGHVNVDKYGASYRCN